MKRILILMVVFLTSLGAASLSGTSQITQTASSSHTPTATSSEFVLLSRSCDETKAVRAEPRKDPNADRFGFGPWYVNSDQTIWAGWDVGSWVSGSEGNKVLWIRPQGTELKVTGRRLDADSPPLKISIPCCYPTGFQATRLVFPSPGCWEVNAKAGRSSLKFVAKVK